MMSCNGPWIVKYDESLKQHYYYNEEDGSICFDTPCEVKRQSADQTFAGASAKKRIFNILKRQPSMKKTSSNIITKIGSVFHNNNNSKHDQTSYPSLTSSPTNSSRDSLDSYVPATNNNLIDDEYLLNNVHQFKNFTGTSLITKSAADDDDAYSIDSMSSEEESITSLSEENYRFARLNRAEYQNEYSYNDYHYYYDENNEGLDGSLSDREAERRELRAQMMKELEI